MLGVRHDAEMFRHILGLERFGKMQSQIIGQPVRPGLLHNRVFEQLEQFLQRIALRHGHILQDPATRTMIGRDMASLPRGAEVGQSLRGE